MKAAKNNRKTRVCFTLSPKAKRIVDQKKDYKASQVVSNLILKNRKYFKNGIDPMAMFLDD